MHTQTHTTHVLKHAVTYIWCARSYASASGRMPAYMFNYILLYGRIAFVCAPLLLLTISWFDFNHQMRCKGKYFDKTECNMNNILAHTSNTETFLTTKNHAILRDRNMRMGRTPY